MEAYLNKICNESTRVAAVAVNNPKVKKYCNAFVKGEDGYCIHYIKPEALMCDIKLTDAEDAEHMTVKAYEAAVVNCTGQCKVKKQNLSKKGRFFQEFIYAAVLAKPEIPKVWL